MSSDMLLGGSALYLSQLRVAVLPCSVLLPTVKRPSCGPLPSLGAHQVIHRLSTLCVLCSSGRACVGDSLALITL